MIVIEAEQKKSHLLRKEEGRAEDILQDDYTSLKEDKKGK